MYPVQFDFSYNFCAFRPNGEEVVIQKKIVSVFCGFVMLTWLLSPVLNSFVWQASFSRPAAAISSVSSIPYSADGSKCHIFCYETVCLVQIIISVLLFAGKSVMFNSWKTYLHF